MQIEWNTTKYELFMNTQISFIVKIAKVSKFLGFPRSDTVEKG